MTTPDPALAVLVVRNTATHDARVLRSARTLQTIGYRAQVLAVTSDEGRGERATLKGVEVTRLTPNPIPLALPLRRARAGRSAGENAPTTAGQRAASGSAGSLTRAYRLLRTLDYYRRGIAAMRALRPRIVHCNDYNTMWIGIGAKLLVGSALVYDSHELWADRNGRTEPRWWLLLCEALFVRVADGLLATSPGHAEEIARRYRVEAPRVVRNIPERRVDPKSRKGKGAETQTIVYVGAVTTTAAWSRRSRHCRRQPESSCASSGRALPPTAPGSPGSPPSGVWPTGSASKSPSLRARWPRRSAGRRRGWP